MNDTNTLLRVIIIILIGAACAFGAVKFSQATDRSSTRQEQQLNPPPTAHDPNPL